MENITKASKQTEIYGMRINEDLKKYQKDKRVLQRVAEITALLAEDELPIFIFDMEEEVQAKKGYAALFEVEELSVVHEPASEYRASKPIEKA